MYFNNAPRQTDLEVRAATLKGPALAIRQATLPSVVWRLAGVAKRAWLPARVGRVAHLLNKNAGRCAQDCHARVIRNAQVWWALYAQKNRNTRPYWEGVHAAIHARRLAAAAALSAVVDSTPRSAWETIALADEALNT